MAARLPAGWAPVAVRARSRGPHPRPAVRRGLPPSRRPAYVRLPVAAELAGWAHDAGWTDAAVEDDPAVAIRLPDAEAFATWRSTGSRGAATAGWSEERHAALTADMLAATPRQPDGGYAIPFGAFYLTARN